MENSVTNPLIQKMFSVGAHFGYSKSRRHASIKPFIFGVKNHVEIFDLEKTNDQLARAKEFVAKLGETGKVILFVGNKPEARLVIKEAGENLHMPYVAERWLGGTLTNFPEITKRIARFKEIKNQERTGEISKYTKKERGVIARERADLERFFGGILDLAAAPAALFVVDPRAEAIAVREAKKLNVPVIALANSDCDIASIDYPIIANDASRESIKFFTDEIVSAYQAAKKV